MSRSNSLFIGDLDPSTDEAHLRQWIAQTIDPKKIGEIKVVRDYATSESRLYGYLNFQTPEVAREVLDTLNYSEVPPKRKPCRMMWCQPNASLRRNDDANLFVKNISPSITIREFHELFRDYGTVISCRISPYHRKDTGHHGYVQFEKKEDAETALEKMDKQDVKGLQISVEKAMSPDSTKHDSVFIGNLAEDVKKEDLKVFFEPISQEAKCVVILDASENTRGFGFAKFENEELAKKAVDEMNGKDLKGKPLNISIARTKKERVAYKKKLKEQTKWRNLYVRNFPLEFTDEDFLALFESYGKVTSCKIVRSEDGISRGFGFCCFEKDEEARQCLLKLSETEIQGQRLQINYVQSDRKIARPAQPRMNHGFYNQGMQMPSMHPQEMMMMGMSSGMPGMGQMGMPGMPQMPMNYMTPMGMGQMGMGMPIGGPQMGMNPMQMGLNPRQLVQPQQHRQPPRQHVPASQRPQSNLPTGFNMNEYREMPDEDKKQYVGEFLYQKVVQMDSERAGQITGMILELGLQESFTLLQDDSGLAQKIREAQGVLQGV